MNAIIADQDGAVYRSAEQAPSVRWALATLSLAVLLSSLGTSIANVALPNLAEAFNASFQEVQWIVLAYLLAITTTIVSVGRLGDITGRKRLLFAGIFLFTVASSVCGVAPTLWLLIAARALQGLGAAIMMALTMAFVGETVPKAKTGSAIGLLGTMSAIGTALGPSLGGILIAELGWRVIFLINLPLGVLALFLAHRYLPNDRKRLNAERPGFDGLGTLLLALTLAAYALAMTTGRGSFGPFNVALLLASVFGAGLFVLAEKRAASTVDSIGDVPQSRAEFESRHEHARLDGDDGDAGGRAVLSFAYPRARRRACWTCLVRRPACCCTDRRASRTHCRPVWATTHDHHGAPRNGSGRLHAVHAADDFRHPWLHRTDRRHYRQLRAVPDRQQHQRHDGCQPGPARRHFRHAQLVTQPGTDHRGISHGRCVRPRIGDDRHNNGTPRGRCQRYAHHVLGRGGAACRRARNRGWSVPSHFTRSETCSVRRASPRIHKTQAIVNCREFGHFVVSRLPKRLRALCGRFGSYPVSHLSHGMICQAFCSV
jgi:hypothetical protein